MDPNHWNTYNLQYTSGTGGLAPGHPSLNRLDLSSGLSLGHTLQATHGSLSSRGMTSVSGVNYPGLSVPLLDSMSPLASGISGQAGPKTLSLAQSPLVYEPQVRGNPDHSPANVSRYESSSSSKAFRPEALSPRETAMARNQILEAAAARVWGSTNFPASSLYNQFGSIMSEVPASTDPVVSSPSAGNHMTSLKSQEPSLHNPPPAHSSGIPRHSAVQRVLPHPSESPYIRSGENLVPSSMAHVNTLYSSTIEKDTLSSSQLSSSLHRQTPVHIQHVFPSSREDIEDLSSNSQSTLYGSYANLAGADAQDFTAGHMSAEMNYEAVSPAPPISNEVAQSHSENASFQMAHFSEFANMAPDHPQNLSDKFQDSDIRLKMDTRLQHDALSFSHVPNEGQDLSCLPKVSKDLASFVQSMQTHHRPSMIQQSSSINQALDMPHVSANISHPASLLQPLSLTSPSSLQQNQVKPPVQAMADSTTKPKRRNRKKKDGNVTIPATISDVKKSSMSQDPLDSIQKQQISQHSPQLLSMPPSSHISTLTHPPLLSQSSQIQQQPGYGISGANQFSSRDSHRAQTPSVPQNYSNQEHQSYPPSPSPKVSLQSNQTVMRQSEFTMPSRNTNGKSGSYKQGQRKSKQVALTDVSINQNSHLYSAPIPESPLNMQNYPVHNSLMSQGSQRDSPMHDIHSGQHAGQHISRLPSYTPDQPQQGSIASQLSRLSQQSPQGSIPIDSPSYSHNKINGSNQYNIGSSVLSSVQQTGTDNSNMPNAHHSAQSSLEPSPVSVESSSIPHAFDSTRNPVMVEEQDSGQFQMDFGGQPFLEQLAGVPIPSNSYSHHSAPGNGEVVYTSLGAPPESTPVHHQQQQQPSQLNNSDAFRPSYETSVQEVRPVTTLTAGMSMGDDVAFNPFFETQQGLDPQATAPLNQPDQSLSTPAEPDPMTLTFVPQVGEDDDFNHFSVEPIAEVKKEHLNVRGKSESFQESFLSYLQGNKQETLSSVSSATITKRPQLPKYIPEPRRPRPQPPPPPPLIPVFSKENSILVSDDENSGGSNSKGKDRLLNDNESVTQKSEAVKDGYSVQRTSELAVRITLPKGKKKNAFGESALLSHNRKMKESHSKFKKRKGKDRDSDGEEYLPEEINDQESGLPHTQGHRSPSPQPMRASIGRKAKEKVIEKTRKRKGYSGSGSSTEEEITAQFLSNTKFNSDDSDRDYDSDKDPVWMPFSVDLKQGHDFDDKRKKPRKTRSRVPSVKSSRVPAAKIPQMNPKVTVTKEKEKPVVSLQKLDVSTSSSPQQDSPQSKKSNIPPFEAGQYLIEKKDLQNYESYPVWRLEDNGSMIHKFEHVIEGGQIKHKAVGTYSTWMKSMRSQFQAIKVKELSVKGREAILIQVLEEFRPKPSSDGKLILQYEDDPLVEPFNVYLQVFLSQALEPNFLKTIVDQKEAFYMEALDTIDKSLETKLGELADKARWTHVFKEALYKYPLMKEIDRPNLKQACQACENSNPPTIKSVVLSGHAYDRVLLTDLTTAHSDSQEYMIGKTAAYYVRTYHTLCHYKYWLHRRCHSKVKLIKESSKAENLSDEMILDRCLENRNWVLQLFDDLKQLLTYGGDVPR